MSHKRLIDGLMGLRDSFAQYPVELQRCSKAAEKVKHILTKLIKRATSSSYQVEGMMGLIDLIIQATSTTRNLITQELQKKLYLNLDKIIDNLLKQRFDHHPLTFFAQPKVAADLDSTKMIRVQFLVDVDGTLAYSNQPYINIGLIQLLLECKDRLKADFHLFTRRSKQQMATHFLNAFKANQLLEKILTDYVAEVMQRNGLPIATISTEVDLASNMPGEYYQTELKFFERRLIDLLKGAKDFASAKTLKEFYFSAAINKENELLAGYDNAGKVLQFQQMHTHLTQKNPNAIFVLIDDWTVNLNAIEQWGKENPCNLILIKAAKKKTIEHYRNELTAGLKKFGINVDFESRSPASKLTFIPN